MKIKTFGMMKLSKRIAEQLNNGSISSVLLSLGLWGHLNYRM